MSEPRVITTIMGFFHELDYRRLN